VLGDFQHGTTINRQVSNSFGEQLADKEISAPGEDLSIFMHFPQHQLQNHRENLP
jgi:hypothetical protein